MAQNQTVDFDSLLDSNIADFADAKEFGRMPEGSYRVAGTFEVKESAKDGRKYISLKMTVLEVAEALEGITPAEVGSDHSFSFFIDTEFGQGQFKKHIMPLMETLGVTTPRELCDNTAGTEYRVAIGARQGKKDDLDSEGNRKLYAEIKGIVVG